MVFFLEDVAGRTAALGHAGVPRPQTAPNAPQNAGEGSPGLVLLPLCLGASFACDGVYFWGVFWGVCWVPGLTHSPVPSPVPRSGAGPGRGDEEPHHLGKKSSWKGSGELSALPRNGFLGRWNVQRPPVIPRHRAVNPDLSAGGPSSPGAPKPSALPCISQYRRSLSHREIGPNPFSLIERWRQSLRGSGQSSDFYFVPP